MQSRLRQTICRLEVNLEHLEQECILVSEHSHGTTHEYAVGALPGLSFVFLRKALYLWSSLYLHIRIMS